MTIRRLKTYTGSQGYVYQYYFVGKRLAVTTAANEYIFDVTSDRKLTYAVSIFLPDQVVAAWAESHGRTLGDSEQYAAVKMRLFRAFDELEDMPVHGRHLHLDLQSLEQALATRRRRRSSSRYWEPATTVTPRRLARRVWPTGSAPTCAPSSFWGACPRSSSPTI